MPETNSYRLLLVQDNPGDAKRVDEWLADLRECRLDIDHAATLAEAVGALADRPYDGIVLDLALPDSAGIATLQKVVAAAADVPIIVHSSSSEDSKIERRARMEGAVDVVAKDEASAGRLAQSVLSMLKRSGADQSRLQFENLVTMMPDAVIVTDRDGRVQFVNQAARDLFGITREDFVGERIGFAAKDGQSTVLEVLSGGRRRSAEMRVVECLWNRRAAFLAMIRDVTEQKQLGEQLRQAQKMEAIGLLAGGIAHDFNNLLLVMLLYAEMIQEESGAAGRHAAEMQEIIHAIERGQRLTGQLLTFSRRQPVEMTVLNLADVVSGLHSMLRRTLPAHIEIAEIIADGAWPTLADQGQIEQVLMNLAINARDAMPSGGRFLLEIKNMTVEARDPAFRPGDYAVLQVSDSGIGMDTETLTRIFEPFFTTKKRGHGTGLGLATCYGIITQADGYITVDSTVGIGTKFTILLPRAYEEAAKQAHSDVEVRVADGGETILVVDDDVAVSRATCRILQSRGYHVLSAANGHEACRILQRDGMSVDLVVSDVVMPQMGGIELAGFLSQTRSRTPIIFITGYSEHPIAQQEGDSRIKGRLTLMKPFSSQELLRVVRETLDLHRAH